MYLRVRQQRGHNVAVLQHLVELGGLLRELLIERQVAAPLDRVLNLVRKRLESAKGNVLARRIADVVIRTCQMRYDDLHVP